MLHPGWGWGRQGIDLMRKNGTWEPLVHQAILLGDGSQRFEYWGWAAGQRTPLGTAGGHSEDFEFPWQHHVALPPGVWGCVAGLTKHILCEFSALLSQLLAWATHLPKGYPASGCRCPTPHAEAALSAAWEAMQGSQNSFDYAFGLVAVSGPPTCGI